MSLAAIAQHISVLEKAGLIAKRRRGKEKVVRIVPKAVKVAAAHLSEYEKVWSARFDSLEKLLVGLSIIFVAVQSERCAILYNSISKHNLAFARA